jgi:hypothetical protein
MNVAIALIVACREALSMVRSICARRETATAALTIPQTEARRLLHRLRFWRDWGRELPAEIDRRLRPLEEAGEKQVIIDIWVLRQLLNRPPRMAAERRTKLLKEASDELIAEAKDELAALREKARGRRLRKEEIDPIIADLRRLTGWSEATVVDRLNLSKKKY